MRDRSQPSALNNGRFNVAVPLTTALTRHAASALYVSSKTSRRLFRPPIAANCSARDELRSVRDHKLQIGCVFSKCYGLEHHRQNKFHDRTPAARKKPDYWTARVEAVTAANSSRVAVTCGIHQWVSDVVDVDAGALVEIAFERSDDHSINIAFDRLDAIGTPRPAGTDVVDYLLAVV